MSYNECHTTEHIPRLDETGFTPTEVGNLAFPFNDDRSVCVLFGLANMIAPHATEYDLLVGEDTSGRLATMVMRSLINQRREAQGLLPITTRFFTGEPDGRQELAQRALPQQTETSRSLLITEHAYRGRTMLAICDKIKDIRPRSPIDVGAVTAAIFAENSFSREELPHGSRLFATLATDTTLFEGASENHRWLSRQAKGFLPVPCDPYVIKTINFDRDVFVAARQSAVELATHFNAQINSSNQA